MSELLLEYNYAVALPASAGPTTPARPAAGATATPTATPAVSQRGKENGRPPAAAPNGAVDDDIPPLVPVQVQ